METSLLVTEPASRRNHSGGPVNLPKGKPSGRTIKLSDLPADGEFVKVSTGAGEQYAGRLAFRAQNDSGRWQIGIRDGAGYWYLELRALADITVITKEEYQRWNTTQVSKFMAKQTRTAGERVRRTERAAL